MPEVLILCAHRPHRSPSQRYRFEQYLPYLSLQGYHFTYSYLLTERQDRDFYSQGKFLKKVWILAASLFKRFRDLMRFKKFDIIFIQREANFLGFSFFEKHAYRSGAKVIFDFDDSIWLHDTSPGNKKWEGLKRPLKFYRNASYAHLVIAGNDYLAQKARLVNANVTVIPTTIDTSFHVPMPQLRHSEVVTIGWSGSISTVKHFELLIPVFIRLKNKYGSRIRFRMVGAKNYTNAALEVEALEWSELTEVENINSFDIGVMPLPDDEWANGKCGLKALAYMACGVPPVISAVGVNREIITTDLPNGFLVTTDDDWFETLGQLIDNNSLRSNAGYRARDTVIEKYSVVANRDKYLQAFRQIS